jgi:hypothetical protein
MNEIGSLLITTTCLAAAGLGIFLFSSKSNEPTTNSKGGKKQPNNKKSIENPEPRNDKENDITIYDDINEDSSDDISEEYAPSKQVYNNKSKPKNKTKRNVNKFSYSKKKYYY